MSQDLTVYTVDSYLDFRNIESSGSDVSGNEDWMLLRVEIPERLLPFPLESVSVNGGRRISGLGEIRGEEIRVSLLLHEHQTLVASVLVQDFDQTVALLELGHLGRREEGKGGREGEREKELNELYWH